VRQPAQPSPALDLRAHVPDGDQASAEHVAQGVEQELLGKFIEPKPVQGDRRPHEDLAQGQGGIASAHSQRYLGRGNPEVAAEAAPGRSVRAQGNDSLDLRPDPGTHLVPSLVQVEDQAPQHSLPKVGTRQLAFLISRNGLQAEAQHGAGQGLAQHQQQSVGAAGRYGIDRGQQSDLLPGPPFPDRHRLHPGLLGQVPVDQVQAGAQVHLPKVVGR